MLFHNLQNTHPTCSDPDYCRGYVNPDEPSSYSDPVDTATAEHPKLTGCDYETSQSPDNYLSPLHSFSNAYNNAMEYSNDTKLSYSTVYDDTRVSSSLSGGDEVECFSDPGHSEEAIYSCFESKRFRTINANTVR